jgi:hypothetical protein
MQGTPLTTNVPVVRANVRLDVLDRHIRECAEVSYDSVEPYVPVARSGCARQSPAEANAILSAASERRITLLGVDVVLLTSGDKFKKVSVPALKAPGQPPPRCDRGELHRCSAASPRLGRLALDVPGDR